MNSFKIITLQKCKHSKYIQMNKQQQPLTLLEHLNNLPLHLLVTILEYLDQETQMILAENSTQNQNSNQIFLKLVSMSAFASKYLRSTDRSVYLNFYSLPAFAKYQSNLLADICVRDPSKYFRLQTHIQNILRSIKQQLQGLQSRQELTLVIENLIRDPQIPFPKMRKEGFAIHCNSPLQFALADLFLQAEAEDDFIEDSVMDLEAFLQCLGNDMDKIMSEKVTKKCKGKSAVSLIKQCYYHPELLNSQNYQDYLIQSLAPFNLFVYFHALLSSIAELYHQYILDQSKDFQRFVEFSTRFNIFRSTILHFQSSKLSKIIYSAVERILHSVNNITEEKQSCVLVQQVIIEAPIQLQNKISGEYEVEGQQLNIIQSVSRLSSQVKTQRSADIYRDSNIQMSGRMLIAGGKIWVNQCRRVRQLNQENPSPSKFISSISQQTINNKTFIKLLNNLLHVNLLGKIQSQVQQINYGSQRDLSPTHVVRDEDIANIFGNSVLAEGYNNSNGSDEALSPMTSHSNHSYISSSPLSPSSPGLYSNFNDLVKRSASNFNLHECYLNSLRSVENKIRTQPYRFQKSQQLHNQTLSNSPDKEHHFMQQIQLQSLQKLPSLRQKKLLSKASMLSKFTKISETKVVGNVEQLFETDNSLQEQILLEYYSYLTDLSVNQCTVHWCGHTQQYLMGDLYASFQEYAIKFVNGFLYYLVKIVDQTVGRAERQANKYLSQKTKPEDLSQKVLKRLFDMVLEYLDIGFMSKKTLKKLLKTSQELLCVFSKRNQQPQIPKLSFGNNLDQVDKMIAHYNREMWHIGSNIPEQKLKIYQRRKSPRNIIQVLRCQNSQNQKQKQKGPGVEKKPERKRRNSEQVLTIHNME